MEQAQEKVQAILTNIERVIVGKRAVASLAVVALLADGHVLLEDVPGVGKTLLVKTLARSIQSSFKRIQFTPDLLPSDITGVSIFNPNNREFEFREGPIFSHIVLADEINRTSPKTQAALLEAMAEGSVTIDGETRLLAQPFFVMATQNPIEYEGTYSLPEAQLDRFLMKLSIGYPSHDEEVQLLSAQEHDVPLEQVEAVITTEHLLQLKAAVKTVYVDEKVKQYIVSLVERTRQHQAVRLGVSPRGSVALMRASQAFAFMYGRDYVIPDDVKYLAPFVLSHRLLVKQDYLFSGKTAEHVIAEIVERVAVPVQR